MAIISDLLAQRDQLLLVDIDELSCCEIIFFEAKLEHLESIIETNIPEDVDASTFWHSQRKLHDAHIGAYCEEQRWNEIPF